MIVTTRGKDESILGVAGVVWGMNMAGMDRDVRFDRVRAALRARNQSHILRFWPDLSDAERDQLLTDIESIPWAALDPILATHVLATPQRAIPAELLAPPVYPAQPPRPLRPVYEAAKRRGESLLRSGKVAALTVAGGQGTRLGFDGPKGCLPVTPVRHKSLFQLFGETVLAARSRYSAALPWYIMTSAANHKSTVEFFEEHGFFGLPRGDVVFFQQAMLPAFDFQGRLLMEERHRLALAPDGHGGSLKALVNSGGLREMQDRGVEVISYFQIDNPLVKPFDPLFIGLHAETGSEMSTKVTPKSDDLERVGNVCVVDGKTQVIEYSELPESLAHARNPDGSRTFNSANVAVHLMDVAFVDRVIARSFQMPFRRAEKIVSFIDECGVLQRPNKPNAVKLETFVFDVLPLARNAMVFEVERAEEFSPVKNATGVDSLETSRRDQIARAARWLEAAGVTVPRSSDGEPAVALEIAPSYALDVDDLRTHRRPGSIETGEPAYWA